MKAARHLKSLATTAKLRLSGLPEPTGRPPEKLLVLGYAAIGDFIMFLPVLQALRAGFPKARIFFLANPNPVTGELVPASGLADEVWLHDWEGPRAAHEQKEINARIAGFGFDAAVLTLSSPAHYFQEGLATIPLRAGHLRPSAGLRRALIAGDPARRALLNRPAPMKTKSEPALARNLRLLTAVGLDLSLAPAAPALPVSAADRAWAENELAPLAGKTLIGLHLGPPGNQYFKMWAPERFGAVCRELSRRHPKLEFVVVGDAADAPSLKAARREHPLAHSWVGRASLTQSFALTARCSLFLSNDTGPAKAAAALNVPTVTVMGPTDWTEVGIPWEASKHAVVSTGIACSPCVSLGMARPGKMSYLDCGHHDCLGTLETSSVLAAVDKLLGKLP